MRVIVYTSMRIAMNHWLLHKIGLTRQIHGGLSNQPLVHMLWHLSNMARMPEL